MWLLMQMGIGHAASAQGDDQLKLEQQRLELERKQMDHQQQLELQKLQMEAIEAERKTLEAERKLQELSQNMQQHKQVQLLQLEALEVERKTIEAERKLQLHLQEQQLHQQKQQLDMIDELGPLSSSSAGSLRRQQQQSVPPPPSASTYRTRLQTISAAGIASVDFSFHSTHPQSFCRAPGKCVQHDMADGSPTSSSGAVDVVCMCWRCCSNIIVNCSLVCSGSMPVDLVCCSTSLSSYASVPFLFDLQFICCSCLLLNSGVAAADVEAALMSRSLCDGQGLLGLTADDLVALQLPTPALRLLHSSLDALRYFL
jgi:hypothetical protein